MAFIVPPSSISGTLRFEWIDSNGVVRDLTQATSPNRFVSRGALGLGGAPVEIADDKLPFSGGSIVRHINTGRAQIEIPITIQEDSFADLILVLDDMRGWFDTGDETELRPGIFRVTRPDDSVRQYLCYYRGGLEGDLSQGAPQYVTVVVSLLAPDPWPTESADTVVTWSAADLPSVSVLNGGQLPAYPIWTITGPASGINVTNNTTGKAFELSADGGLTLGDGQSVVIDTRPASQRTGLPVLQGSTSRYSKLTADSDIARNWLDPGTNNLTITLAGTSGSTEVELAYRARYRGLLR